MEKQAGLLQFKITLKNAISIFKAALKSNTKQYGCFSGFIFYWYRY